jgi:hypothetical protein
MELVQRLLKYYLAFENKSTTAFKISNTSFGDTFTNSEACILQVAKHSFM